MSEVPSPVSESTAIEVARREGTGRSFKSVDNGIAAGDIVYFANSSGVAKAVGGTSGGVTAIAGVALYTAASGARCSTIRGKVKVRWDGVTAGPLGSAFAASTTRSGYVEVSPGVASSGSYLVIGQYIDTSIGTLAAANSGTLVVAEIF